MKGGDKEAVARLTELPEAERPKLVVFDLNNLNAKPMTLIPKLKTKLKKATSIVGFLNHLQSELKSQGHRGRLRHGDAAVGIFADPAQPAAPLWRGRRRRVRHAACISG